MKRPASESEPIGMSAIDLFASGMGAFMLIALVFMVLFAATPTKEVPQTPPEPTPVADCPEVPECPECPDPVDCPEVPDCPDPVDCPEVPECPECPDCPEVEAVNCPQPVPVPEPITQETSPTPAPARQEPSPTPPPTPVQTMQLPDTDLVFMVDTTGSMRAEIDSLKRELHIVVEILERMMPSVGIGVVTFNDRQQRPQGRQFDVRRITGDEEAMREIQRFLRSIAVGDARGSNTDIPEAVLAALQMATTSSFRPDVKDRVVVVITDAYAYDDEVEETLRLARSFASAEGQRISTVHVRQNEDSQAFLERLAEAGGGEFVPDRGSILANILLSML